MKCNFHFWLFKITPYKVIQCLYVGGFPFGGLEKKSKKKSLLLRIFLNNLLYHTFRVAF